MKKTIYIYFILLNVFLAGYFIDTWHNANTVSRLLPVKTLVENSTWCIDQYHEQTIDKALINGHYYSEKAPLPAFIVLPFYFAAYHTGLTHLMLNDDLLYMLGSLLIGTLPFLFIILLIFHSLLSKGWNIYKAMLITLLLAYSTFIFIYAGTPFSHVMAALWMLLSFIYLDEKKKYAIAGLFAGLAFITEYPTGLILFIWPMLIFLNTRKFSGVFQFYSGTLPCIVIQLIYNYVFTGNALDMLYNHQAIDFYNDPNAIIGFALPIPEAMWKLLFGFYRGLFFHAPILMIIIFWMIKDLVIKPSETFKNYVFLLFAASYLLFSSYRVWYGGWCFGPRHFVPVAVLLLYYYAYRFTLKGIIGSTTVVLSALGIIYVWMAKCTIQYSINADLKNTLTQNVLPAFHSGNFNPNNILSKLFGTTPQFAAYFWLLFFISACLVLFQLSKMQEKHMTN